MQTAGIFLSPVDPVGPNKKITSKFVENSKFKKKELGNYKFLKCPKKFNLSHLFKILPVFLFFILFSFFYNFRRGCLENSGWLVGGGANVLPMADTFYYI